MSRVPTASPLLALLLTACGPPLEAGGGPAPPNVLFVTVDTLRADSLGLYGYDKPTSPRLDEFARSAVVFENAMSSASWTLPSFASLFTSYFTSTHNCWRPVSNLDDSFETLAEVLNRNGYDTACCVSHPLLTSSNGVQQGFVHFDDTYADPSADMVLRVSSQEISERGIRFLRQKAAAGDGVPWLLWLHYFDPHATYVEHEGITERFIRDPSRQRSVTRGTYDGEIRYTDECIGQVFDALDELGLTGNTVVVFVADHGEEFFDHGGTAHGSTLFNELVRVPLILRIPGIPPQRVHEVVRTVDVMPTLLDLAGIRLDYPIEGRSLLPILRDGKKPTAPALLEIGQTEKTMMKAIVQGRWKLVHDLSTDRYSLYDMEADPQETTDVAVEHPDLVEDLRRRLGNMVDRALEYGSRYHTAVDQDLTPGQLEQLQGLGYLGDE